MQISEDQQTYTDFDWFCVDAEGRVGHFASAGFKRLPKSVIESAEDLSSLEQFFRGLTPSRNAHELDLHLTADQRTERYLRSFVDMADRGLYSFDIESYLRPGICYFRVAMPKVPLRFEALPDRVREILGRIVLRGYSFQQCSAIPYSSTQFI